MRRARLHVADGSSRPCRRSRPALPCDVSAATAASGCSSPIPTPRRLPRLAGRGGARSARERLGLAPDAETPVHLIVVPQDEDGLRRVLARVHRRTAGLIHAWRRRTGHFWQGRYRAVAMVLRGHDTNFPYQSTRPPCGFLPRLPGRTVWPSFISTIAMKS
jgi:hypothetical protein